MDNLLHSGKVRDVYNIGENFLIMKATDRVSSFDKHIGTNANLTRDMITVTFVTFKCNLQLKSKKSKLM